MWNLHNVILEEQSDDRIFFTHGPLAATSDCVLGSLERPAHYVRGPLAQLVECYHGMVEVTGSRPVRSTISLNERSEFSEMGCNRSECDGLPPKDLVN